MATIAARSLEEQRIEQRILARLIRLWEDYTVRQLFPEAGKGAPETQFTPTLLVDLRPLGILRCAVLTTGADGRFRREAVQLEGIAVAAGLTDARERVDLAVFKRKNYRRWKLGTRGYVADLARDEYDFVDDITAYVATGEYEFADLFEPVVLKVAQVLDRETTVAQVQWVTPDEPLTLAIQALRERMTARVRTWAALTDGKRVSALLRGANVGRVPLGDIRGFVFCDSPARLPQSEEQYLLLTNAQAGALFTWQAGRFEVTYLSGQDSVSLSRVARVGHVAEAGSTGAVDSFASREAVQDLALAHYLMWHPALLPWEISMRQRKVTELRAAIAALEQENQELAALRERLKRVKWKLANGQISKSAN